MDITHYYIFFLLLNRTHFISFDDSEKQVDPTGSANMDWKHKFIKLPASSKNTLVSLIPFLCKIIFPSF